MAEEEGKKCYGSSAVSEYYQFCFGCGDAETIAGKPALRLFRVSSWMLRSSANNIVLRGDGTVETTSSKGSLEVFH